MRTLLVAALIAPLALAASVGSARAADEVTDAELTSETDGEVIAETARALEVRMSGLIATVTERSRFVAPRGGKHEAVYRFTLPAEAAVHELAIKLQSGKTAKGFLVSADAAANAIPDADTVDAKPDVALLRRVEWPDGAPAEVTSRLARYELRVYPVDAKGVEVKTTWTMPVRYHDSRLVLRVPARGGEADLADAQVSLEIAPPIGAGGFLDVSGGGTRLARNVGPSKGRYKFKSVAERDLVIDATPWFSDDEIWSAWAAAETGPDEGIIAVALLAPPSKPSAMPHFDHVLLVLDASRSMGASGLAAARDVAAEVLGALGKGTRVEAILFDRTPRRVLGSWQPNDRETQRKIAQSLAIAKPANGSDLGAALDRLDPILREVKDPDRDERGGLPTTLIVIVSDGIAPLDLDGIRARDRLGDFAADDSLVVSVTIAAADDDLPDPYDSAAGCLAAQTGGRAISIRDLDAASAAKRLARELTRPTPLATPILATGSAYVEGLELPAELAPGEGVVLFGRYRGPLPKEIVLSAQRGSKAVAARLVAGGPDLTRALVPLHTVRARVRTFMPPDATPVDPDDPVTTTSDGWREGKKRFLAFATRAQTVTAWTSFAALDPDDAFARDRLALVDKYGGALYQRLPPPPEREAGRAIRAEHPDVEQIEDEPSPRVTAGTPRVAGSIDKSIVRRLVHMHVIPLAKACYDRALRGRAAFSGDLTLLIEMSNRGELAIAGVDSSTLGNPTMEACVVDAAYTIDVPRAIAGQIEVIKVRYPLQFRVEEAKGKVTDEEPPPLPPDPQDPLWGIPQ